MSYVKQIWQNNTSPLSAERFNHIEDGIASVDESITTVASALNTLSNAVIKKSSTTMQSISSNDETPLRIAAITSNKAYIEFEGTYNLETVLLGKFGANESNQPLFNDGSNDHILAYASAIPTKTSQLTNDSNFITAGALANCVIKSSSAPQIIACTGSSGEGLDTPIILKSNTTYGYLTFRNSSGTTLGKFGVNASNQPIFNDRTNDHVLAYTTDLPTVNDATITFQVNGSTVDSFTLNQASNKTINLQVATTQVQSDWNETDSAAASYIKNKPDLTGFVKTNSAFAQMINSSSVDTSLMISTTKVDGRPNVMFSNGYLSYGKLGVDSNHKLFFNDNTNDYEVAFKENLATVATSGSYNDLSNKPTIPTKVSDLTNDSGFITQNDTDSRYVRLSANNQVITASGDSVFYCKSSDSVALAVSIGFKSYADALLGRIGIDTNTLKPVFIDNSSVYHTFALVDDLGSVALTNNYNDLNNKPNLAGGTTGQVLTKLSDNDNDFAWRDGGSGTAGAYNFVDYISTNTLPFNPQKGDTYESDSDTPLVFTIGGGGGGGGGDLSLRAIQVDDVFNQGDYIYFDNTISDSDMLTFLQGLTYDSNGMCTLVGCVGDGGSPSDLLVAMHIDISGEGDYIYALTCYTLTDDTVVWISESAMGMTAGWQSLTEEGGLLLDFPDGEQTLTVITLNTNESGWNGIITFYGEIIPYVDFVVNDNCSKILFDTSLSVQDVVDILDTLTYTTEGEGQYRALLLDDDDSNNVLYAIKQDMGEGNYAHAIGSGDYLLFIDIDIGEVPVGWNTDVIDQDGIFTLDDMFTVGTIYQSAIWNGIFAWNYLGGSGPSVTITINKGDWLCYNGITWQKVDNQEYASTSYVDNLVGDINNVLDAINGEEI